MRLCFAVWLALIVALCAPTYALGLSLVGEYKTEMGPLMGVFASEEGIFLASDRQNTVIRYSIEEGKLKKNGTFGGGDKPDSMGAPVDFWVDGGYLYVLDISGYPHIFNTTTRELEYRVDSGTIIPQHGSAISVLDGMILIADKERGSVLIASEYAPGKYALNRSINPSYMGPLVPALASPEDIYVYNRTIFIADAGNQRVQVYSSGINYTGFYGGTNAPAGYWIGYPYRIAVDSRYLYVVPYGGDSIIAVSRESGKIVAEFRGSSYGFGDITGICEHGGKLYVALGSEEKLLIFSIRQYENLTYDEAYAAYSAYAASVERYCEISALSKDLSLELPTSCSRWRARLADAKALLDQGDYDSAYEESIDDSQSLAKDLMEVDTGVRSELTEKHAALLKDAGKLAQAAGSAHREEMDTILALLSQANSSIHAGNYTSANVNIKEASVRISSLANALGETSAADAELLAQYSERIGALARRHGDMRAFAESCGMGNLSAEASARIAEARSAVEAGSVSLARERVAALEETMAGFEDEYSVRLSAANLANGTIARARDIILATRAGALPFFEPNYTAAEESLEIASGMLCTSPQEAKALAEKALAQVEAESKSYEDTKLMLQFVVGTLVFVVVVLVLFGTGVRNILKILDGMGKRK
ncbi:MAG: hypothetical protein QXU54_02270 [Candidatus Micrarchaeia archaeon]